MNIQAPCIVNFETREEIESLSLSFSGDFHDFIEGDLNIEADVGVLLPTYCEAANMEKLISEIENLDLSLCILVLDDCSPDGTANIARVLQKKHKNILLFNRPEKTGLGTAITDGFKIFLALEKPPKYIVTMDADYSHNPRDIPRIVATAKEGKGLAIGSRYRRGGRIENWSVFRLATSRVANLIASIVVRAPIRDHTSGFRCYSTRLVKTIVPDLHCQTYEIQIETIRQAVRRRFNVREVPIIFMNRKKGKSKLSFNEIKEFVSYAFFRAILHRH
jgi:dolichol-phosphate mannosyltransferase